MEKGEGFNRRLRWKAHYFDKKERLITNMKFRFKSYFTA